MKFTRRDFIKASLASSTIFVSVGLQSCKDTKKPEVPVSFLHGVASGDPLDNSILLWTRVTPDNSSGDIEVMWEVATDEAFKDLVNMDSGTTNADRDYTLKVDVKGLSPETTYFYRFKVGDAVSPIGKTHTLPNAQNITEASFLVFSCSNYPAGYFNVYRQAFKEADNITAALHLGDYIYEYGRGEYASEQAAELGREVLPKGECITLDDYRTRYAQYRTDTDLQALHATLPWIVVWDDHEIANDAWTDGAENHDDSEGSYDDRKAASLQAYFEWLPLRPILPDEAGRIYRQFVFGDLVNLLMLDTRRIGRNQQLDYANYMTADGFNGEKFIKDVSSTERTILGAEQRNWLVEKMTGSSARWQVLGQQVLMARMLLPAITLTPTPLNPTLTLDEYATIAIAAQKYQAVVKGLAEQGVTEPTVEQLIAAGMTQAELAIVNDPTKLAALESPLIPYNLDAWDGYAFDREVILNTAKEAQKNLVVLAGDTHNAWSSVLSDVENNAVGIEFATSSVSSPGLEKILGLKSEQEARSREASLVQLIKDLEYCNLKERGYMVVSFTPEKATSRWVFVDTISNKNYNVPDSLNKTLSIKAGETKLES